MLLKLRKPWILLWVVNNLRVHTSSFFLVNVMMSSYKAALGILFPGGWGLFFLVIVLLILGMPQRLANFLMAAGRVRS